LRLGASIPAQSCPASGTGQASAFQIDDYANASSESQSEATASDRVQTNFLDTPLDAPVGSVSVDPVLFTSTADLTGDHDGFGQDPLDVTNTWDENVTVPFGATIDTLPDLSGVTDTDLVEQRPMTIDSSPSYLSQGFNLFSPSISRHSPSQGLAAFFQSRALLDEEPPQDDLVEDTLISPDVLSTFAQGMNGRLYCPMPWPDDMLASPERRFLWQYFLSVAEADFLCLDWEDVGYLYGFQHPYITSLPQLSLTNEPLRNTIFCFAAGQYQLRHGRSNFAALRRFSSSKASRAIMGQSTQQTYDDNHVLSMIYALPLLHYFSTERQDHKHYLRICSGWVSQLLARRENFAKDAYTSSVSEVPLTEFRWAVISTLCSLAQTKRPLGDQVCRMIEMGDQELRQNYSEAFRGWVSHPIYTFSPRLVNPLLRIGNLLEKQLFHLDNPGFGPDPVADQAEQIAQVEEMLLHARDCDIKESSSCLGGHTDPSAVVALNESMYSASTILLYARLHGLPMTAPFIRRQVHIIVQEIAKISVTSRVSYSIVFPLFIAGCEAADLSARDLIKERLHEPKGIVYDRGDLVAALEHIWEIRDLEPGLPWPSWVSKGKYCPAQLCPLTGSGTDTSICSPCSVSHQLSHVIIPQT
jgi:hypothetical protein